MSLKPGHSSLRRDDIWVSSIWIWSAVLFFTLIIANGATWFVEELNQAQKWQVTAGTALYILLHAFQIRYMIRVQNWRENEYLITGLNLAYVVLFGWLIWYSPQYYFLLFSLYGVVYSGVMLKWAIPLTVLLTGLAAAGQVDFDLTRLSWAGSTYFVVATVAAIGMAVWIYRVIDQSMQRRELIEQLEAAQGELAAAERREGIMQERERLSREIHDTLAQSFMAIIMQLEGADQSLADGQTGDQLRHNLELAQASARNGLSQARRVVRDLRPAALEATQSLPDAIEMEVRRWENTHSRTVELTITGNPAALHPQVELTLLRATQESLNNIAKHAGATEVSLTLSYIGQQVVLDIADNGKGLPETITQSPDSGFGLRAMQERVTQIGGELHIESEPNQGTTIAVIVPV